MSYQEIKTWLEKHVHRVYAEGTSEFNVMYTMLQKHVNFKQWKHQTVVAFQITRLPVKKYIQVLAKFEKGEGKKATWRTVSWRKCCNDRKNTNAPTLKARLNSAMRYAIRDQIRHFRLMHPLQKCALCPCTTPSEIEVDHVKEVNGQKGTFSALRDAFVFLHCYALDVPYPSTEKAFWWDANANAFRFTKTWQTWKAKWQAFHADEATLRYLCAKCNKEQV